SFNTAAGKNLDWFWRSWYYETWTLDQAVKGVEARTDGVVITIEDRGEIPMPVRLTITDGVERRFQQEIPVDAWLSGARTVSVTVPGVVTRVEIDAARDFPDVNRENNVWQKGS